MKKIITILLCLLCLVGCTDKNTPIPKPSEEPSTQDLFHNDLEEMGQKYLKKLKEFEPRPKNIENTKDNERFAKWEKDVFLDTMNADYLSMHFTVIDYRSLGIKKPELTLGSISYDNSADIKEYESQLSELLSFEYKELSYRQQYDYDAMEYSLYETLASLAYDKFNLIFNEANGIFGNLITNFSEFRFDDKETIDDYLTLLKDFDRYLEDATKYATKQAEEGIALTDSGLDETINYIKRFLSKRDDNELITSFTLGIKDINLSLEERMAYYAENERILKEEVFPASEKLIENLETLRGKSLLKDEEASAYNYSKGYGEILMLTKASSNLAVEDIIENVENALFFEILNARSAVDNDTDTLYEELVNNPDKYIFLSKDLDETLNYLKEKLNGTYPSSEGMEFIASPLDETVASDSILAYYVTSPIDVPYNVIRTNPSGLSDDHIEMYSTLAHEGFPGHLYQNCYYNSLKPSYLRSIIDFIGYTEGFAMKASGDAFMFSDIENEGLKRLLSINSSYGYYLQSIADLGINGLGWNKDKVKEVMSGFGLDEDATESIYEACIKNPGLIVPYGAGLSFFVNYEEDTMTKMGDDFDPISYHEKLMENGPLPFILLKDAINELYVDKEVE